MNLFLESLRLVFLNILGDFFYFPLWWYTVGFFRMLKKASLSLVEYERDLGIDIWIKNLFVPMYGQYDIAGRIISFFMRLAQIIGRTLVLLIWLLILLAFLAAWLVLPILIVWEIWLNLTHSG
jgi:hypothetical protein